MYSSECYAHMLEIGQIFSEINKMFTKAPGLEGRGVEIASEEAIVQLDGVDSQSLTPPTNTDLSSERDLILLASGSSTEITRHVLRRPLKVRLKKAIREVGILLLRWSSCFR